MKLTWHLLELFDLAKDTDDHWYWAIGARGPVFKRDDDIDDSEFGYCESDHRIVWSDR